MPLLLIVLDGWGEAPDSKYNAVTKARTPTWDKIVQEYPTTKLEAAGQSVGLPQGTIGNSEVGHMNIGAGRIVFQDLTRINLTIQDGSFFKNAALLNLAERVKKSSGALHLMGLLSDGGVHSHIDHLFALLDFTKAQKINPVYVHCFMDGRDTPPRSGRHYMEKLERKLKEVKGAAVTTVMGRYYAMDRDKRWDRTALAYNTILCGEGEKFSSPLEGILQSCEKGTTDEFILPFVVLKEDKPVGLVKDGDSVLFFNFRADRARQLTLAFNDPHFKFFERKIFPKLTAYATMTQYEKGKGYPYPTLFSPQNLDNVFGEVIAKKGLKQFRIAETEKYAHVTYFFNGGQEIEFPGEDRLLIPSPRDVATYDLKPEMSAFELTEEVLKRLDQKKYDVLIMNFANPDMVGHSGRVEPTIKACETVDQCLGKILDKLLKLGGRAIVTADHGNAECMADVKGHPITSHTLNLVPLVLVDWDSKGKKLRGSGKLCDIAPTMLELLNIPKPKEMTGRSLLL